jgi:septal ring factor EnvC (AmiA/AmiB activator)
MSDYVNKKDLEEALEKNNKLIVGELAEVMDSMMSRIDERFNNLELRVDRLEARIEQLTNTIDGFVKRLDDNDTENAARDAQYARLVVWAKEVSAKTGIAMPQL